MLNILLQLAFFLAAIVFVCIFISFGWYMVWKLFLCRFKLVRDLFMLNQQESEANLLKARTATMPAPMVVNNGTAPLRPKIHKID